jgi:hypothetical protein
MADDPYATMMQRHLGGDTGSGTSGGTQRQPDVGEEAYQALIASRVTPQLPPGQMTGWQRELAFPASNVARGVVSGIGLPGDIVHGVGYVGGKAAEQAQNPAPLTTGVATQPDVTPTSGPRIVTPQMLAASPDKPNVPAWTGENPATTESLLSYPGIRDVANRPDLQPQNLRERLEGAGAAGVGAAGVGSVVPALVRGGATIGTAARTLAQGAAGGVGGEAGGEVGEAVGGTPGRVIGTGIGAVVGGKFAPGGGGLGSFIPAGMDAETAALAQRANDFGIKVGVGEASASPVVRNTASVSRRLPLSGYRGYDAENQTAFNRGVAGTFGEDANKITPEVINAAYDRIGPVFSNAARRYDLQFGGTGSVADAQLGDIVRRARESGLDAGQVSGIEEQVAKIRQIAADNNGIIPGNQYINITKRHESLDNLQNSNSTVTGRLAGEIRDTLDQTLMRSATPADVAALREARTQYKALKTVEPLTVRADTAGGPAPSTGDISPAALNARVNQQYDTPRATLGQLPLKDLAQIGQRFLKEPISSGTSERLSLMDIGKNIASVATGMAGGSYLTGVNPVYEGVALAAGLATPYAVGRAMRTSALPGSQQPLVNSLIGAWPTVTGSPPVNPMTPSIERMLGR